MKFEMAMHRWTLKTLIRNLFMTGGITLIILSFQNCSGARFGGTSDASSAASLGTGINPVQPTSVIPAVVGLFYASDDQGHLFSLDPKTGVALTEISVFEQNNSRILNDLAINSQGQLFGKDPSNNIYQVNASTGELSLVLKNLLSQDGQPNDASNSALGLTFLPNGDLATTKVSSTGFSVVSVNLSTQLITTLVPESAGYRMQGGDIKSLPDGYLYWTVENSTSSLCRNFLGNGNQTIVQINPTTGATREITCLTVNNIFGLGYASHALYGFSGAGDLIQVALSTGEVSLVKENVGDEFIGAASNPALW